MIEGVLGDDVVTWCTSVCLFYLFVCLSCRLSCRLCRFGSDSEWSSWGSGWRSGWSFSLLHTLSPDIDIDIDITLILDVPRISTNDLAIDPHSPHFHSLIFTLSLSS